VITELLLAGWLCAPLAPLNPLEQDTLPSQTIHITVGMAGPGGIVSTGPELGFKYEALVIHPFVLRGGGDLKYARTTSNLFPKGNLYSAALSCDALYYRGTNRLTGYVGIGAVFAASHFVSSSTTADSLLQHEHVTSVDMRPKLGYRITLGLRVHRWYSLELAITEIRPDFVKHGVGPNGVTSRLLESTRTGGFRFTVGRVFPVGHYR
jgi:hypothetical protein